MDHSEVAAAVAGAVERRLPRSVLFVSGVEAAPFRYRVLHLVEQLSLIGIPAVVRHWHDEETLRMAAEHDIVVFQRVLWDDYVGRSIAQARRAGALTVFGIDDLLFDPSRPPPFLASIERREADAWMHSVRVFRQTFDACDAFLGSTDALVRAAEALGKKAFLHRNGLSRELISLSEVARRRKQKSPELRLAYFSGTRTHTHDFAQVSAALAAVLHARPNTRLLLVGALEVPRELDRFRTRIERVPVVPWRELPEVIARADVNLAPLSLDGLYCQAKSELKWFEAAVAGVPTIASPTEPFQHAIHEGETGFLASSPRDWEQKILRLVDDASLREHIAEAARRDAIARYGPETSARALAAVARELNALRSVRELRPVKPVTHAELASLKAAGLGIGRAAMEPDDAIPGPEQLAIRLATPAIDGTVTASQTFRCPRGLLYRIDVLVGTHRRINIHDIELRLLDARTQGLLAQAAVDAATACDNAWIAFEFDPVRIEGERELTFVVEAPTAPPKHGLAVWYEPSPHGRGACDDKGPLDLTYRTWFRPAGWQPPAIVQEPAEPQAADLPQLAALLREERDARRALEKRLERIEDRAASAQLDLVAVREQLAALADAVLVFGKIRGTLPYKAARKMYRLLRK
jgi:glycosyltransferase involved in cell wall biosynthesis